MSSDFFPSMKKNIVILSLLAFAVLTLPACQNRDAKKMQRQMKSLAKTYLEEEQITSYDSLTVVCVDTLTELRYARLNSQLLQEMIQAYQQQYEETALNGDQQKLEYLNLYINEALRTQQDFDDLIDAGDLQDEAPLLFMATCYYYKDGQKIPFVFLSTSDKKKTYTLDPFGDNLLYKD